jgi:hypothetical protein
MKLILTIVFSGFIAFALSGCWTTAYQTQMMPDGITWDIAHQNYDKCGGAWHSKDECIENLKPDVEAKAVEICGEVPFRFYNCGYRASGNSRKVSCLVQCKQMQDIKTVAPDESKPKIVPKVLMEKAKKCQQRGGVWVNDSCQIPIE